MAGSGGRAHPSLAVSRGDGGGVAISDVSGPLRRAVRELSCPWRDPAVSAGWLCGDSYALVVAHGRGTLRVWNVPTGELIRTLVPAQRPDAPYETALVSPSANDACCTVGGAARTGARVRLARSEAPGALEALLMGTRKPPSPLYAARCDPLWDPMALAGVRDMLLPRFRDRHAAPRAGHNVTFCAL